MPQFTHRRRLGQASLLASLLILLSLLLRPLEVAPETSVSMTIPLGGAEATAPSSRTETASAAGFAGRGSNEPRRRLLAPTTSPRIPPPSSAVPPSPAEPAVSASGAFGPEPAAPAEVQVGASREFTPQSATGWTTSRAQGGASLRLRAPEQDAARPRAVLVDRQRAQVYLTIAPLLTGSVAEVVQDGGSNIATIEQRRSQAYAGVRQEGWSNSSEIRQIGGTFEARSSQSGEGHSARVVQIGPGRSAALVEQSGTRHLFGANALSEETWAEARQTGDANSILISSRSEGAVRYADLRTVQDGQRNRADLQNLSGGHPGGLLTVDIEQLGDYNTLALLTDESAGHVAEVRQEASTASPLGQNYAQVAVGGESNSVSVDQYLDGPHPNRISAQIGSSGSQLRLCQSGSGNTIRAIQD
jgi:hypothetical protein